MFKVTEDVFRHWGPQLYSGDNAQNAAHYCVVKLPRTVRITEREGETFSLLFTSVTGLDLYM
jgi:hypothetical protein